MVCILELWKPFDAFAYYTASFYSKPHMNYVAASTRWSKDFAFDRLNGMPKKENKFILN